MLLRVGIFTVETCFSAEWDEEICEKYGVEDWSETVQLHSSMKEKPGKDRAMTLAQCMRLFTSEEKLGEHDLWYDFIAISDSCTPFNLQLIAIGVAAVDGDPHHDHAEILCQMPFWHRALLPRG